jgi:hypothetical protein
MRPNIYKLLFVAILITIFSPGCGEAQNESSWQKEFGLSERNLATTGQNKYFILEPGFKLVLKGSSGLFKTTDIKLEITVLNETKEVDGIITRVVEEREWKNNEIYEVSRNFFAADQETGDIFYFGEEVDFYSDGKVINHEGTWLARKDDAKPGLIMPGRPIVGMKYYQEIAPGVAMDRAEIISLNQELETPAGLLRNCLKTKEGTSLNLLEKEFKTYATGIGLVQDENLLLESYGFVDINK